MLSLIIEFCSAPWTIIRWSHERGRNTEGKVGMAKCNIQRQSGCDYSTGLFHLTKTCWSFLTGKVWVHSHLAGSWQCNRLSTVTEACRKEMEHRQSRISVRRLKASLGLQVTPDSSAVISAGRASVHRAPHQYILKVDCVVHMWKMEPHLSGSQ